MAVWMDGWVSKGLGGEGEDVWGGNSDFEKKVKPNANFISRPPGPVSASPQKTPPKLDRYNPPPPPYD